MDANSAEANRLLAFIERVESVNSTIKDEQDARKEIFAEARADGYDTKALKQVIKLRALDPAKRIEEAQIVGLYADAIGLEH